MYVTDEDLVLRELQKEELFPAGTHLDKQVFTYRELLRIGARALKTQRIEIKRKIK